MREQKPASKNKKSSNKNPAMLPGFYLGYGFWAMGFVLVKKWHDKADIALSFIKACNGAKTNKNPSTRSFSRGLLLIHIKSLQFTHTIYRS